MLVKLVESNFPPKFELLSHPIDIFHQTVYVHITFVMKKCILIRPKLESCNQVLPKGPVLSLACLTNKQMILYLFH